MNHSNSTFTMIKLVVLAVAVALSSTVFAESKHQDKDRFDNKHLSMHQKYVYGEVLDVTPIYREIRVSNPVKECWSEPVRHVERIQRGGGDQAAGTLAGALLGGVIGHQIGKGRGNKLATAVGTVIGAQIGHDANRDAYSSTRRSYTRYEDVCEVKDHVSYEEVVDGYKVTYRYKGMRYKTRMPYDPGDRIRLKVSIEPVF